MSAATLFPLPSVRPVAELLAPAQRSAQWTERSLPAAPDSRTGSFPRLVRHLVLGSVVAVVAAVALGVAIALSGFLAGPEAGGSVVVQPGQSLWEVAAQTGSGDVSQTVADIARLNGLTDSTIQAGQTLILPAR